MGEFRNPNLGLLARSAHGDSDDWRRNLGRSRLALGNRLEASWWTGLTPDRCPGLSPDGCLRSLPPPNLDTVSRSAVRDYFDNSWTLTEVLFSALNDEEAFYRPPYHGLRHPLVFYYVHPAALYINKLRLAGLTGAVNPYFESLFETGVDEMSWDDMSKNTIEWPALDELNEYRRLVYQRVSSLIETHPGLDDGHAPIRQDSPLWALFMACEHERIHLETSSVLIRELPLALVTRPRFWPPLHPSAQVAEETAYPPRPGVDFPANDWVRVPAGVAAIGKDPDWPTYGWDNEYGFRQDHVGEFAASAHLITNGEFWQFVAAGGYQERRFWTETGWRWRSWRNAKWPTFWLADGPAGSHRYALRTCFEVIPMQWSWPAVVNYHECEAFASWLSESDGQDGTCRLISEAEHQRLREHVGFRNLDKADLAVGPPANINLRFGSESAVGWDDDRPVKDLFGNVWQWCQDHFNPLPGFRLHRFYDDFSTPCFDGQHQMIIGGSFVSTGDEATPWARFHFRPHFFQHAGFRLVRAAGAGDGCAVRIGDSEATRNPYETESVLNEYLTLHYGTPDDQMPFAQGPVEAACFPQRCADMLASWAMKAGSGVERVLEIGCAVGGASFRLAETFASVEAVDLSDVFIATARRIQAEGEISFSLREEGEIVRSIRASVAARARERVNFRRADACALPPEYVDFDAVLIANVLCRLKSPMACLSRLGGQRGIVRRGGLLLLTTPYTWMEKFTPKEVWLGGYLDAQGKPHYSHDGLAAALAADFDLLDEAEMPLIIREHRRKYQYIVAQTTVWRRR